MHRKHPGSDTHVAAMPVAAGSLPPHASPDAANALAIASIHGIKAGYVLWRAAVARNFGPERA